MGNELELCNGIFLQGSKIYAIVRQWKFSTRKQKGNFIGNYYCCFEQRIVQLTIKEMARNDLLI